MAMAVVMVVVTTVIYWVLDKSGASARQLTHSLQINSHLKEAQTAITDAEARGTEYVLTGNKSLPGLSENLDLTNNTALNPDSMLAAMPEYATEVKKLNTLISAKVNAIKSLVTAVDAGKKQQAAALINTGTGRLLMDSIKLAINAIQVAEGNRRNVISAEEVNANKSIFTLLCSGVMICLLLLLIFYQMILRNAKLREKTEDDLVEAKNIAEAANRAKTNFLATMSHEIRTPMHNIISTASMLAETPLTSEQQKYAGIIQRSSMTLLAVVNDIIDFGNIETGRIPLDNSAFALRDCLEEVLTAAGTDNTGNKINYRIDGSLPRLIDCDPVRLRQVLMTITSTSLKNNITGHIDCNVRLVTEADNVLEIEFNIINTHLTPEEMDAVNLQPGEENISVKESLFGMSSIRFSIAARLVSLMGGNIKVTTDTGKSISTTFTIKANKVDTKAAENYFNRRSQVKWMDGNSGDKIPLHILVVDDHELNLALLVQMLTKLGHTCSSARNGVEAAGMAIEEKFDIVFMDISMPVMDGIDATKRIREYYINTDTPLIIGVTANALFTEKQKGFDAGMNDFLIKPYKPVDIKNMLDKWTALVFKMKYEM